MDLIKEGRTVKGEDPSTELEDMNSKLCTTTNSMTHWVVWQKWQEIISV